MTSGGYTAQQAARLQTFGGHPRDLETIVTCLELSAISLTDRPDQPFTKDALFAGVLAFEPRMQRRDLENVFAGMSKTFARVGQNYTLR